MKFKMCIFAVLLGAAFMSCSKNEDGVFGDGNTSGNITTGGGSLELTLGGIDGSIGSNAGRAVGLPATKKTTVANLTILFTDVTGDILYIKELSPESDISMWNALMGIGTGESRKPVMFHDLPVGIEQVHILGNISGKAGVPYYAVGGNVSIFATAMFDLANLSDISSAILAGKDTALTSVIEPVTGHTVLQADFAIAPTVARFEIGNIQCNDLLTTISSFNVNAISIDNIFERISFDGTATTAPETVKKLELVGGNNEAIGSPLPAWAFDEMIVTSVSTTDIFNPQTANKMLEVGGNGKYVYHFVPQRQHVSTTADATLDAKSVGVDVLNSIDVSPLLRLELSYVIPSEGMPNPNRRWVTAIFDGESNPRVFEAGKIYQINLSFKESNIGVFDPSLISCVEASVKVSDWVIAPAFTPDFE